MQDVTELLRIIDLLTARDRLLIAAAEPGGAGISETGDKLGALVASSRLLFDLGVPHALIGGVAVGIHSRTPRATIDTNFAIASATDRHRVIAEFLAQGFRLTGEFAHSINFRHASGEPVQLALDLGFDAMIGRAVALAVQGTDVPVVTREDLIAMKERAAANPARRPSKRLRDRADVALLQGDVPDPDEG